MHWVMTEIGRGEKAFKIKQIKLTIVTCFRAPKSLGSAGSRLALVRINSSTQVSEVD